MTFKSTYTRICCLGLLAITGALSWSPGIAQDVHTTTATATIGNWVAVPGLPDRGSVLALASDASGNVYAAGRYVEAEPPWFHIPYVKRWDGSTWTSLDAGFEHISGSVATLAMAPNGTLYAGLDTSLDTTNYEDRSGVYQWTGSAWALLGDYFDGIRKIITSAGSVPYALGHDNDVPGSDVFQWNGTAWSGMGGVSIGDIDFDAAGNLFASGATEIRIWNGTFFDWYRPSPLGPDAVTLFIDRYGRWWAGEWGGVDCNLYIWNQSLGDWTLAGGGISDPIPEVREMVMGPHGHVFVGGHFEYMGANVVNNVARVANWFMVGQPLGTGTDDWVTDLELTSAGLWVGGNFEHAGGKASRDIALYVDPAVIPAGTATQVAADGPVDFGGQTAIDIVFSGLSSNAPAGVEIPDFEPVTVERFLAEAANIGGMGADLPLAVHWTIEDQGTLVFAPTTELRINLGEMPSPGVIDPNLITVYHRDTIGNGDFLALPTVYDGPNNELVATGFTSFSEFTLATVEGNLPVELVSFTGVALGSMVKLQWATASEVGNAGYEIEGHRSQVTGQSWHNLGFVAGHGTTDRPQSYTFRVEGLVPGKHRFRLKQIDYDGTFEYSPVIEVAVNVPGTHFVGEVYPNPAGGLASFEVIPGRDQRVRVALYDVAGRKMGVLIDEDLEAAEPRRATISTSDLPSGVYFVLVDGETFSEARRFVVTQ
jgi:hypothetical protein